VAKRIPRPCKDVFSVIFLAQPVQRRLVYIAKTITVDESAIIEKTWIHHDEQNGENLNALDGLYFDEWIPDGKVEAANVKRMTRGQYTRLLVPCEICETEDTRRTFYLNTEAGGCLKATMSLFSGGGGETCAHVMSGHLEHLVAVDISPSAAKTIRYVSYICHNSKALTAL
jgi:hypothetical protein